jgi:hypothetical protein
MQKRDSRSLWLIWALLLVLPATFAMAQSDSDETSDDEGAEAQQSTASEDKRGVVYTTDYLKERFGEKDEASPEVISEETLSEQPIEVSPDAFTNEDLRERFGGDEEAATETDEAEAEAEAEAPAEPEAAAEPAAEPAAPAMSSEERARLVSEIDDELKRLEKRLLALKNPLLAGTAPPTPDERYEEE